LPPLIPPPPKIAFCGELGCSINGAIHKYPSPGKSNETLALEFAISG